MVGVLPKMELLRGMSRLILYPDKMSETSINFCHLFQQGIFCLHRVRSEAVSKLAWFLTNEKDSLGKEPQLSDLDVSGLSSLFIVDLPKVLVGDQSDSSVFQIGLLAH